MVLFTSLASLSMNFRIFVVGKGVSGQRFSAGNTQIAGEGLSAQEAVHRYVLPVCMYCTCSAAQRSAEFLSPSGSDS